jgi:membrane protein
MGINLRQHGSLLRDAASAWKKDDAAHLGAAISYYTLFSIAPLLLIMISIVGLFYGTEAAQVAVMEELRKLLGDDGARAVRGLIASAAKPKHGALGIIIGVFQLLMGATTVFLELQQALDKIWRVPAREVHGIWASIRSRLLSFGLVLSAGFLLLISLVLSAAISLISTAWGSIFGEWGVLISALNLVLSFLVITVLFALIYRYLPEVDIEFHDVWIGAAVTALLFTFGKYLIGTYIGRSGVTSGLGAAGSVIVVLLWVYYSVLIFLFGAEYAQVYANKFGSLRKKT